MIGEIRNMIVTIPSFSVPAGRLFDVFVDEFCLEHPMKSVNRQTTVGRHWRNVVILKKTQKIIDAKITAKTNLDLS